MNLRRRKRLLLPRRQRAYPPAAAADSIRKTAAPNPHWGDFLTLALTILEDHHSNETKCYAAAAVGSVKCLKLMHERGFPWNADVCEAAARSGSLSCLRYAREHGCPWCIWVVCSFAYHANSLSCLRYAHQKGCMLVKSIVNAAALAKLDDANACVRYVRAATAPPSSV